MIRNIKISAKAIASVLFMIAVAVPVFAAESYGLIIKLKNGEKKEFVLSEKPVIKFDNEYCDIESANYKTSLVISDIDMGSFGMINVGGSGISEANENMVRFDLTDSETAVVSGIATGTIVSVYGIDGLRVTSSAADENGVARLDLSKAVKGSVYIVSVNSVKNFKIVKK